MSAPVEPGKDSPPSVEVVCNLCGGDDTKFIRADSGYSIRRCTACGLIYVSPQPRFSADEDVEYLSREPASTSGEGFGSAELMADALKDLLEFAGRPGRVLDVGCGYGFFLAAAREQGWTVAGVDVSHLGVEFASQRLGLGDVHRGHLASAPYPPASFDAVTMFNVLEHVTDPRSLLRDALRLLRPGGTLLVRVPNMAFHHWLWAPPGAARLLSRAGFVYLGGVRPPQHLYGFSPTTLRALLYSVGFVDPDLRPAVPHHPQRGARRLVASTTSAAYRVSARKVLISPTILAFSRKPASAAEPGE